MAKYQTEDGIEVDAVLIQGRENVVEQEDGEPYTTVDQDFWEITFPDGSVKEVIDTHPLTGDPVFASMFQEI